LKKAPQNEENYQVSGFYIVKSQRYSLKKIVKFTYTCMLEESWWELGIKMFQFKPQARFSAEATTNASFRRFEGSVV